ncbi:MAG: hypothetical protein GY822_02930 [Deltaproteobacteria bacterium]|nr:hypothetical protein [Deltaproteobacteria bacterium]
MHPPSYDCAVFGQIAGGFATKVDNGVTSAIKERTNLVDWVHRMNKALDWK